MMVLPPHDLYPFSLCVRAGWRTCTLAHLQWSWHLPWCPMGPTGCLDLLGRLGFKALGLVFVTLLG